MILVVRLTVSKVGIGQRSEGSRYNKIGYKSSLKCNLGLYMLLNFRMYTKWPALAEVCALRVPLVISLFHVDRTMCLNWRWPSSFPVNITFLQQSLCLLLPAFVVHGTITTGFRRLLKITWNIYFISTVRYSASLVTFWFLLVTCLVKVKNVITCDMLHSLV